MCSYKEIAYERVIGGMVITDNPGIGEEFKSIEDEAYREYDFGFGRSVRIEQPVALRVSKSGGHYVVDQDGVAHYLPNTWIGLKWENYPGAVRINF
jgi:hypothetical protein